MQICLLIGTVVFLGGFFFQSALAQSSAQARIAVQGGRFVENGSGKNFSPIGANYFRLHRNSKKPEGGHGALCQGAYDPEYIEKMMADLETGGFNTLRVFHSYLMGDGGILRTEEAEEIAPEYVANLLHLLVTARQHGIRIIFTWDIWLPSSKWLAKNELPNESLYDISLKSEPGMGANGIRFSLEGMRTRANSIVQLIEGIKRNNPNLLSTVLAWELENEIYFRMDQAPFNMGTGSFCFNGRTYFLDSDAEMQALMDDNIIVWSNLCAGAIRKADPDALVSVGVFSFAAVGRIGPEDLIKSNTQDNRAPARLKALVRADLDYLDLHLYGWKTHSVSILQSLERDLLSVEWEELIETTWSAGKPIIAGETGIFATQYLDSAQSGKINHELAAGGYRELVTQIKKRGFSGALYWIYGNPDITSADAQKDRHPPLEHFPQYGRILTELPSWNSATLRRNPP